MPRRVTLTQFEALLLQFERRLSDQIGMIGREQSGQTKLLEHLTDQIDKNITVLSVQIAESERRSAFRKERMERAFDDLERSVDAARRRLPPVPQRQMVYTGRRAGAKHGVLGWTS